MEIHGRFSGDFQNREVLDITVDGKTINHIQNERLAKQVDQRIEEAEKMGLCERTPFGVVWLNNNK